MDALKAAQGIAPTPKAEGVGGTSATQAARPVAPAAQPEEKLLTKKMAGERALFHHLFHRHAGRSGPKYEAKVIPGEDREHYTVKLYRLAMAPPFTPDARAEAVYSVDRRNGEIAATLPHAAE